MSDFSIVDYGSGNIGASAGIGAFNAAINALSGPFYKGKVIDAQANVAVEALEDRRYERIKILETLGTIANNTSDQQVRQQMFQQIAMIAMSWQ